MKKKTIELLLPALLETEELKKMTQKCKESLVSEKYKINIHMDIKRYPDRVAGAWNNFFDKWRGKDYDYLFVVGNDTIADPKAIDYMIKCLEENPKAGVVCGKVERDLVKFKEGEGKQEYTSDLTTSTKDPACFVIRKGIIEKVGRCDAYFPIEFVERDYLYRLELAGWSWIQPDIVLWYHPPRAATNGNDPHRFEQARRKYWGKWGGDPEVYVFPFNDPSLDFTYCKV
jgi:hypothetical protein